jgi:hypothetical protein
MARCSLGGRPISIAHSYFQSGHVVLGRADPVLTHQRLVFLLHMAGLSADKRAAVRFWERRRIAYNLALLPAAAFGYMPRADSRWNRRGRTLAFVLGTLFAMVVASRAAFGIAEAQFPESATSEDTVGFLERFAFVRKLPFEAGLTGEEVSRSLDRARPNLRSNCERARLSSTPLVVFAALVLLACAPPIDFQPQSDRYAKCEARLESASAGHRRVTL